MKKVPKSLKYQGLKAYEGICHDSTSDNRELKALVGQNVANHGSWESGLLRFYYE